MSYSADYVDQEPSLDSIEHMAGLTVLEFGAPWCGYCQAATPFIKSVLSEAHLLAHIKVFDGKGKRLGRAFQVKLWPSLILLNNGKEVARLVRPESAEQVAQLIKV